MVWMIKSNIFLPHKYKMLLSFQYVDKAIVPYDWYFLQAVNFRYFRATHDSAKITSYK